MMLLRANTLAKGHSGVRPVVIDTLVRMLNKRVHPVVPLKGSVGASGDLAPLSHLALVLMGEGEAVLPSGVRRPATDALRDAGILPLALEAKEGLALNNGTQFMTAVGVLAFLDAEHLVRVATLACALSLEAVKGVLQAFDARIHQARRQQGQEEVACDLRRLLEGSEILSLPVNTASLRNAQESLERMAEVARDADQTVAEDTRDVFRRIREKTKTLHQRIEAEMTRRAGPLGAMDHLEEELRRAAATRVFEPEVRDIQRICERVWSEASPRRMPSEARKRLQLALEQLQAAVPESLPVQDDYSFRCAPQVIGAALDSFRHVRDVLTRELNAATDNPLIFPPEPEGYDASDVETYRKALNVPACERAVVSGGNFHGAPVARP